VLKFAGLRRAGVLERKVSGGGFVVALKGYAGVVSATQAGILFCGVLLLLVGCATPPTATPPPGEVIAETNAAISSPLNWTNPAAKNLFAPPPVQRPGMRPIQTNQPPTVAPKPAPSATTWTPLKRWAAAHHVGAPHRLSDTPVASYAIGSSNGVMVLEIGTHEATWNGTQINLGFEPQFIDGQVFLNELDLEKNLKPLLCGPPLAFGDHRIIVIDPGHGGNNTGTRSVLDGRFEKEFTLDWAKRLKPLLETNGWTVFLTRTSDAMVSNYDRVTFAEAHHADLFISLHFNAPGDNDKKAGGLETYCLTPTGLPSTLTRGFRDIWSENLPNNAFDTQNLQLAVRIQAALVRATGLEDRGVRYSRFETVLRGQNCPAILIEGGYLSNPREAALIESPEYRQKLARAVAEALK
jgi:N-acetylmuramoyl-L-alanine amidase